MELSKRPQLTINSYQKLWKWNMKIYALSKDLPLPRALPIRFVMYMVLGGLLAFIIFQIPILQRAPVVLKIFFIIGFAKFLDTVKVDGKNPILFFIGYIYFLIFEQGTSMEKFNRFETKQKNITLNWYTSNKDKRKILVKEKTINLQWVGGTKI